MNSKPKIHALHPVFFTALFIAGLARPLSGQTLINIDFGGGAAGAKSGFAATGVATNDVWNHYHHYAPRFLPGMPLVPDGRLEGLKFADGTPSQAVITVTNAPGVWGNSTGDPMLDNYIFAPNGSNILVTLTGLEPGRYHFYLYGYAAADVSAEQNTSFALHSGTNGFGPSAAAGAPAWTAAQPWRERAQFVVFRDVPVTVGEPVTIEAAPGPGGVAVINGLQIISRGTSSPRLLTLEKPPVATDLTNLLLGEVHYTGSLGATGAWFSVTIEAESRSTNEITAPLFEGDLALLSPKLPEGWRVVNQGKQYVLYASVPGKSRLEFQLAVKVLRAEPWDQVSLIGPSAAIATVEARVAEADAEVHLLSGTPVENGSGGKSELRGVIGADRRLALRWQSKTAEVAREAVIKVDTSVSARLTPAAIRYTSQFHYEVLQSRLAGVRILIPDGQTLTQLQGDGIRDWRVEAAKGGQTLLVEFLRPVTDAASLTLATEQSIASLPASAEIRLAAPLGVQRENGSLSLSTEDVLARVESADGLRQVDAGPNEIAAYQFNTRPVAARIGMSRVEPLISVSDRVHARLEETRLLVRHELDLEAERAAVFNLDLVPPPGFVVAEVRSEGLDDWKLGEGKLRLSFSRPILGHHAIEVQLEQALTNTPAQLTLLPMRVTGAAKESAFIGAGSSPGLQIKSGVLAGAREISVNSLPGRKDELLAFRAETADWRVALAAERLAPRVVADVFNLITIGDGVVGGSATIRFGIVNQGVQQFRLRLPKHWRNVEFTGPNIRRRDQQEDIWTVALQDKAWGGYTLVITYDYAFDPKKAALDAAGAHPLEVERETGTVAVTSAANLSMETTGLAEPLRKIDPSELSNADRSLISRRVLLASRYEGTNYALGLTVTRHAEITGLEAIADRAQLTTVLTEDGEMLTEASFMVKNNERQFQRFELPGGASLWGVTVNNEPVKADRDGNWLLVPLPREENRDETFNVDLKYAQHIGAVGQLFPKALDLTAPRTDVPGTYAEWELYVPRTTRPSGFDGNMTVARGTTYGLHDAWKEFIKVYAGIWHDYAANIVFTTGIALFIVLLIIRARRGGLSGAMGVVVLFFILTILASMMLPALSKAKARAQRINSVSNLKQIGVGMRLFANDHDGRMGNSFEEMLSEITSDRVLVDPETGERYTWVGAGKSVEDPDGIAAYSSEKHGGREVLLMDGSVQQVTAAQFAEMVAKDAQSQNRRLREAKATTDLPPVRSVNGVQSAKRVPLMNGAPDVSGIGRRGDGTVFSYDSEARGVAPLAPAPTQNGWRYHVRGSGGGGGFGGVAQIADLADKAGNNAVNGPTAALPTTTGIKSLRIEIPKSGRAINFTRVLNLSGEPATIRLSLMSASAFLAGRTLFQVLTFVFGLCLVWMQWRRAEPKTLWLAIGAALAIVAVTNLLIGWRLLGVVFILGFPTLLFIALIWILARFFRRRGEAEQKLASPLPPPMPSGPGVSAAMVLVCGILTAWQAEAAAPTAQNGVSIAAADYTGAAYEHTAQIEATLNLITAGTNQTVTLFGKDVAIEEFKAVAGEARLWRNGENIGLLLPERGPASVRLKILLKLGGDASRRQLELRLPPALASHLALTLDEEDAEVEFPDAIAFTRTARGAKTLVEAVLGASDHAVLNWTPHYKRAADIAATVFARQSSLVTLGDGVANTRSILEWQISQGELRELRVAIPEGQRLLKVTGEGIRSWDLAESNRAHLVIHLLEPVSPAARVVIETERSLGQLPAEVRVMLPRILDVKRETGSFAVRGGAELGLIPGRTAGLERMDNQEFARGYGDEKLSLLSAFRFLTPDFDLSLRVEAMKPRIEALVRNEFSVGQEQLSLTARVDYAITRAGVFSLKLALPREARIDAVNGNAVSGWAEHDEAGSRTIEIALKQRTLGEASVEIRLTRSLTNLPAILPLTGVHPLEVDKLTGFVSVSAEPGVGLKTSTVSGLSEIPPANLPGAAGGLNGTLAFKYVLTERQASAPWNVTLATELLASWVRAEIVSFVSLSETLATGRAQVRYEVLNAPVKEFRLKVPAAWRNVEITGAGIRRRDEQTNALGSEWRVQLQGKAQGEYRLTLHWEEPRKSTNQFVFQGIEAVGAERETGAVGVFPQGQIQISAKEASEQLLRIDARELPEWDADRPAGVPAVNYRYLRPGWSLTLEARRFEDAALLQALVDSARLRTVVADDGQFMTQMELSVRNNGRQNLAVALPPGATVWAAFVDGQPVRPSQKEDELLLPLERSGADDAPISVELTYVGAGKFPHTSGEVELVSPRLDVPLKDARWEVFLPPDYLYENFKGTMTYESAEVVPVVQDFTVAEYRRQESAKQESFESKAVDFLKKTKGDLALGIYDNAAKLNNYQNPALRDQRAESELKSLEKDLSRVQSSNLIQAQKDYAGQNSVRFGVETAQLSEEELGRRMSNYDDKAAEEQVAQLQKAQAVAVTRVTPLHVNLPTRGLRYSFVQVLQTEVNKPLTIRFGASNDRDRGWLGTVFFWAAGFLVIWFGIIIAAYLRPAPKSAPAAA